MDKNLLTNNLIARWLDGRLNDAEKKQLDKTGELDALKIVLDDIDTWKVKKFDTNAGLAALHKRKKEVSTPTPTKSLYNSWFAIAASILIFITGGYLSFDYFTEQPIVIKTVIAENKTIELPRGSFIKLDALSNISYQKEKWEDNRTVYLSGQAFFDVTKGSSFKVNTPSGSITVLGTQFNVNATPEIFKVHCYEGKVTVVYNEQQKTLTKGQSVTLERNRLVSNSHTTKGPEWIDGYSKYNKEILSEIISDLEKYYTIQIELPKKYDRLQFTGTITHKDLNIALQTLFTSMEIIYTLDKNKVTIE